MGRSSGAPDDGSGAVTGNRPVIEAGGVTRRYGRTLAVDGVDLEVDAGEVVAVVGPNGAGKTTLVEILEGLRCRDAGRVAVFGEDPRTAGPAWRRRVGAVLQQGTAADELTVGELLDAHAAYYGDRRSAPEAMDELGLAPLAGRRISHLSGGQRRRVDLAVGLAGRPELLFLDEPTTGLDPEVRRDIWELVRRRADDGCTVVLTTHHMEEVERLADRMVVLVGGRVASRATPADLAARSSDPVVTFELVDPSQAAQLAEAIPGPWRVDGGGAVRYCTDDPTEFVRRLMEWVGDGPGRDVAHLRIDRPDLEQGYLDLIEGDTTGGVP